MLNEIEEPIAFFVTFLSLVTYQLGVPSPQATSILSIAVRPGVSGFFCGFLDMCESWRLWGGCGSSIES